MLVELATAQGWHDSWHQRKSQKHTQYRYKHMPRSVCALLGDQGCLWSLVYWEGDTGMLMSSDGSPLGQDIGHCLYHVSRGLVLGVLLQVRTYD